MIGAEPDMHVVCEAKDGTEAVAQYRMFRPDVAVIDLQMPTIDGFGTIEAICGEFPSARIVVLTSYPGDARVKKALALGATAYLLKTATRDEILTARAIHAAADHERSALNALAQAGEEFRPMSVGPILVGVRRAEPECDPGPRHGGKFLADRRQRRRGQAQARAGQPGRRGRKEHRVGRRAYVHSLLRKQTERMHGGDAIKGFGLIVTFEKSGGKRLIVLH